MYFIPSAALDGNTRSVKTKNEKIANEISRARLLGMIMAGFAVVMSSELKRRAGETVLPLANP